MFEKINLAQGGPIARKTPQQNRMVERACATSYGRVSVEITAHREFFSLLLSLQGTSEGKQYVLDPNRGSW